MSCKIVTRKILPAFALLLLIGGCKDTPSTGTAPPGYLIGRFSYSGYSTNYKLIVTGIIDITRADSILIGSCTLQPTDTSYNSNRSTYTELGSDPQYPLEAGAYNISGNVGKDGTISIYLRGSVQIYGTFTVDLIAGTRYIALTGPGLFPFGHFTMQKEYYSSETVGAP